MMNDYQCLTDRTLRYGRNLNILSFATIGVMWMDINLYGANIFGLRTDQDSIWLIIFMMLLYNLIKFGVLVYIDFPKWRGDHITDKLPFWSSFFSSNYRPLTYDDHGQLYKFITGNTIKWCCDVDKCVQGSHPTDEIFTAHIKLKDKTDKKKFNVVYEMKKTDFNTIQKTLYHAIILDIAMPIVLSLVSLNIIYKILRAGW